MQPGLLRIKTEFLYDNSGRLEIERNYIDAVNYVETQYVYGATGQVEEAITSGVKDADGAPVAGSPGYPNGAIAVQYTYNTRGLVTSQTDANGNMTGIEYDDAGRIEKVTNPDGSFATYSYDISSLIVDKVVYTNEAGAAFEHHYDKFGRQVGVYYATGQQMLSSTKYNSAGRVISNTIHSSGGEDITVHYTYDLYIRPFVTITKDQSGAVTSKETKAYAYTDSTLKTTTTILGDANSASITTTSYVNNMGDVVKAGRVFGGVEHIDTYAYDYVGNLLTERTAYTASINGAVTNTYTYDFAGRVLTAKNALGQTASMAYDWLGNNTAAADYSGNTAESRYDALGRLIEAKTPFEESGGVTEYAISRYYYDQAGNVVSEKHADNAPGAQRTWARATSTPLSLTP